METSHDLGKEKLFKKLTSRLLGERVAAQEALQRMGPEAVTLLLEVLREEAKKREKKHSIFRVALASGLTLAGSLALLLILNGHPEGLGFMGAFGGLGGLAGLLTPTQRQVAAINVLAQLDDPRALGPLIEGLTLPDINIQAACTKALMRIAPRVKAEDAASLDNTHFATLRRLLGKRDWNRETELTLMLLHLVTVLEDTGAIPVLEKMLEFSQHKIRENTVRAKAGGGSLPEILSPEEENIFDAARHSMRLLRECQERLKSSEHLLRASSEPTASPETLLRAASATTPDTDPNQLLRAGQNSE